MTKLAERWLILIAKLMAAILMLVVPVVVAALTMMEPLVVMEISPQERMEIASMNQNLNARDLTKLNVTQFHALSLLSTVRIEKKKSARSSQRRFLFQSNVKIVMMKTRKFAN